MVIKINHGKFTIAYGAFNPLSPNNDQHQISPCKINAYSTPEVMRIKDMITQSEFSWYFNKLLPSAFIRKVWRQDRKICSLISGVIPGEPKGTKYAHLRILPATLPRSSRRKENFHCTNIWLMTSNR